MNLPNLLQAAGVPDYLHPEAIACIELADERSRGLLWHKIKARFFRAVAEAVLPLMQCWPLTSSINRSR